MGKIIGIDLRYHQLLRRSHGGRRGRRHPQQQRAPAPTPSVVAFSKTGERLVGQVAKRQAITNPGQDRHLPSSGTWASDYKVNDRRQAVLPLRRSPP